MNEPIRHAWRAGAVILAVCTLAACSPYYYDRYGNYRGPYRGDYYAGAYDDGGYYGGGYAYDECYGRYRAAYCRYPTFDGEVTFDGRPYRGLHYRNGRNGREFWYGGRWRRDVDRDGRYRDGRYHYRG